MGRDGRATRDRILDAAFREFSDRGFAGARVDDIATRASCNKALLYQHYGDKEQLFRQVLECKLAELGSLEIDADRFADSAGEFFDFHAANPWLMRLIQWEALDFGTERVPSEDERSARFARWLGSLVEAQRTGGADPELDPRQALVTLVGLISFYFAAPQIVRMILGGDPYSKAALRRRREHVVAMARRILEADT